MNFSSLVKGRIQKNPQEYGARRSGNLACCRKLQGHCNKILREVLTVLGPPPENGELSQLQINCTMLLLRPARRDCGSKRSRPVLALFRGERHCIYGL